MTMLPGWARLPGVLAPLRIDVGVQLLARAWSCCCFVLVFFLRTSMVRS